MEIPDRQRLPASEIRSSRVGPGLFAIRLADSVILYDPWRDLKLQVDERFHELLTEAVQGSDFAAQELCEGRPNLDRLLGSAPKPFSVNDSLEPPTDSFTLFLTLDCTMRCIYCYAQGGHAPKSLELAVILDFSERMIHRAKDNGRSRVSVHIHGGDISRVWPLFEQTVEGIREQANQAGVEILFGVGTNGLMTPTQREFFLRNMSDVTVSLDGDAPIQDRQRPLPNGAGSWNQVSATLRAFDEAGFQYGIRSTITAGSVARMPEFVGTILESFATRQLKVEPVFAPDSPAMQPDPDVFVDSFLEARRVAKRHQANLVYSGLGDHVKNHAFCTAASGSLGLTPDHSITSCYEVLRPEDPLASTFFIGTYSVAAGLTLREGAIARLRDEATRQRESCLTCFALAHCAGDCLVKRIRTDSDIDAPRCRITRALALDRILQEIRPTSAP